MIYTKLLTHPFRCFCAFFVTRYKVMSYVSFDLSNCDNEVLIVAVAMI